MEAWLILAIMGVGIFIGYMIGHDCGFDEGRLEGLADMYDRSQER